MSIMNLCIPVLVLLCLTLLGAEAFGPKGHSPTSSAIRQATSSKDLKDRRGKRKAMHTVAVDKKPLKRTAADIGAGLQRLARSRAGDKTSSSTTYPMHTIISKNTVLSSEKATRDADRVGDLTQLTEAIDERLQEKQRSSSEINNGLIKQSRDSMGALLGYNSDSEIRPKSGHEIVVVFGKPLIDDQVTVEYASRIRTLALLLKEHELEPDLICFCGDISKGNHISDADAGFLFFKQICADEGISLKDMKLFVDRTSKNESKALQQVATHIMKDHMSDWVAVSIEAESPTDEYGIERRAPRKKVNLHFTLISNEYHLCNLNDVHRRSPNQSPLRPIEMLRTMDRSHQEIRTAYDNDLSLFESSGTGDRKPSRINGIIDCSWSYKYTTYPYSYTNDDASAFMGRCFLLGEELMPFFINMKGVVAEREFLQRDNYVAAASIRHKLVSLMEDLYKTSPGLRSGLREVTTYSDKKETVDIVLEGATLSLGRCIDLVRPTGLEKSSVLKAEYTKALRWLNHCRTQIQTYCDPDRPLDPSEWGRMGQKEEESLMGGVSRAGDKTSSSTTYPTTISKNTVVSSEKATRDADRVGDLTQLTEAIDKRLQEKQRSSSEINNGLIKQSRDSMGALLGYNSDSEIRPKSGHEIVVVFGKPLIDDQVTVEYASRIRTLALLLKEHELEPDLICFCGDISKGNHISDADAGFLFFKQICADEGISLKDMKLFVDRTSKNESKALQQVATHIMKDHMSDWVAVSIEAESPTDEYGIERRAPRKKVNLHFTLISNEYHLCNLNDVHRRSPNQSPLRPIEMLRTMDRSHQEIRTAYDNDLSLFESSGTGDRKPSRINGIIDCSWSYKYTTYPYSYTNDDASAFMGRCFLLGEELMPFFINMKGVVAEREFLQRDNYVAAASIRHKLVSLMEDLYKTSPGLRSGLREVTTYSDKKETVDIVLEGATLSLGRCIDLVRPTGLEKSSVLKAEYTKALRWLNHCRTQIQTYCDPDRPLDPSEWGRMGQKEEESLMGGGGI